MSFIHCHVHSVCHRFTVLLLVFLLINMINCASIDAWRNRTIYQLLTDRFARPLTNSKPFGQCGNWNDYCGGTFQGIEERLDFIASMGFDAIWISPIVANTPEGYHGYWMKDLFAINDHFGSLSDLQQFVAAAHQRDIWVMLDVVANHVGPVGNNFSGISPFNNPSHYHGCDSCPSQCSMNDYTCFTQQIELCRLDDLPDLNQSVPFVRSELYKFANWVTHTLAFDGLRIDTTPEIDRAFWSGFVNAAGNPLALGEIFTDDVACVAAYQHVQGGALSYPLFMALRNVFASGQSMTQLSDVFDQYSMNSMNLDALGTFLGNHDNARFLQQAGSQNVLALKSAAVFVFFVPGVPIWYYGDEALFSQSNERAPFWTTQFSAQNLPLVPWLRLVVETRKTFAVWNETFDILASDQNFFAFARGDAALVALTNQQATGRLKRHISTSYDQGTVLCNVFWPASDCISIGANGAATIFLDNGEAKIYVAY